MDSPTTGYQKKLKATTKSLASGDMCPQGSYLQEINMNSWLRNKLLPNVDTIMSTFTKTIRALEAKASVSSELASAYREKATDAKEEADRATLLADKLKSTFSI